MERRGQGIEAPSRLRELKDKVDRAAKLIAELRERNHSLKVELADLERRASTFEGDRGGGHPTSPLDSKMQEELQLLRDERKIIRAKVQSLLDRIEKLEP